MPNDRDGRIVPPFDDVPVQPIPSPGGPPINGGRSAKDDSAIVIRCKATEDGRVRLEATMGGDLYMGVDKGPLSLLSRNVNPRAGKRAGAGNEESAFAHVAIDVQSSEHVLTFVFWPSRVFGASLQLIAIDVFSAIGEGTSRDELLLCPRLLTEERCRWSAVNEVMHGGVVEVELHLVDSQLNDQMIDHKRVEDGINASIPSDANGIHSRVFVRPGSRIRVIGRNHNTDSKRVSARFEPKPVD